MSPRLSSFGALLNATLIGVGLALIAGVIWVMGVEYLKQSFRAEEPTTTGDTFAGDVVYFRRDGSPVIHGTYRSQRGGYGVMQYRDLDGHEVEFDENEILRSCWLYADRGETYWNVQWRDRILAYSDQQQITPTYWYFIHDGHREGRGYFVGYEGPAEPVTGPVSKTNSRIGFIGLSGFRQEDVPIEDQFQISPTTWGINNRLISRQWAAYRGLYPKREGQRGDLQPQVYLIAEDALYRIDLKERTSQKILDLPASEIQDVDFLIKATINPPIDFSKDEETQVLVRTDSEILFLDPKGSLQSRVPLPEPLHNAKELSIFEPVGDKYYAVATERKWEGQQFSLRCYPYCFNSQGQVEWSKDVLLATRIHRQDMCLEAGYFWAIGAPLSADFAFFVIGPWEGVFSGKTYLESFVASCEDFYQSNLGNPYLLIPLMHLYALLWAFLAWKRETKYHSSPRQRWMWTVFVYLLGLPALLGYLAHRKWPLLQPCPSCSASAPVDHDTCTGCGKEWPLPVRTGIELIER